MSIPIKQTSWWLALSRAPALSVREALSLLERHGEPEAIFANTHTLPEPDWSTIECDLEWLGRDTHHLLTWHDTRYPELLKSIDDPPLVLFVVGDPAALSLPSLAIVGSRNPTSSGKENAEGFAAHLAECGLNIVSGLASGIDTAAHRGALTNGTTVAVLGTGPDMVYPLQNKRLAQEIAKKGALVTEFPPGTPAIPGNFPQRNRIISGLAVGTLVVEATIRSGSLITARLASEQGREVFAIPGSIHNPMAKGCHHLIRQGAKLVDSADHVLEELGPLLGLVGSKPAASKPSHGDETVEERLDPDYEKLLDSLEDTPLPIDKLAARSGLTPDMVSSMLLIMELRGLIHAVPGGGYAKGPKRT